MRTIDPNDLAIKDKGSEIVSQYLWIFKFNDIDNAALYKDCKIINDILDKEFEDKILNDYEGYGCKSSYYHGMYNLFAYPNKELIKLYFNLQKSLKEVVRPGQYYLRCWLNAFERGSKIQMHQHHDTSAKAYHGFYCVNTEGEKSSHTDYRIVGEEDIRIISRNGCLIIGDSGEDYHASSKWMNDEYRITIAWDLLPVESLQTFNSIHDYIPMLVK